jgi:hypothetical protein
MQSSAQRADDTTLLALAEAGKSTRDIATIIGSIDHSTVSRRLKHLTPRKTTEIYKFYKADILSEMQRKIISSCTGGEIKKMATRDKFMAFGILHDKEMQARGLSDSATRPLVVIQVKGDHAQIAVDKVDNPVDK